jgi:hypothetical protein
VVARALPAAFGPLLHNVLHGCAMQSETTSGSQFSLISRSSVAAFALAGAKALASQPPARRGCRLRGLSAAS